MTDKKQPRENAINDSIGLTKAYDDGNTHIIGNTLYIAGTHTPRDAYDDLTKVPSILRDVSYYIPALKQYENLIYGLNKLSPNIANKINDNLPFSHLGDLTKSERYINAEKALKANPNIQRVVGHSLGGSVALELQKKYPGLKSRTYGAPVLDLKGIIPNYNNKDIERYRNYGDPISIFDRSAHSVLNNKFYDQPVLTHQYQNLSKKFKPE